MEYTDLNGCKCRLYFEKGQSPIACRHVLVIAKYKGSWLLTQHLERGLEFPGGKVEPGETLEQAARRETYEETGAVLKELKWVAEYTVDAAKPFSKTVFSAEVVGIEEIEHMETQGPMLAGRLMIGEGFSFLMKDKGMEEILKKVIESEQWSY